MIEPIAEIVILFDLSRLVREVTVDEMRIFEKYSIFGTLALVDSSPWPWLEAEERGLLALLVKARGPVASCTKL